jgi:uncharacterized DUF497 family protein
MALKFEWDKSKAEVNLKKHVVSFDEAKTVFGDPFARITEDQTHSQDEQRWHIIGTSNRNRIIVVAYTEGKDFIRIITARKAEPSERKRYEKIRFNHT